jgi:hypothetical protein
MTDNVRVRSIVGRFLEHSRIYRFGSGEDCDVFIGSGDMMTRNTERRIELFVPVADAVIRRRLLDMLDIMLKDNVGAREIDSEGRMRRVSAPLAAPSAVSESASPSSASPPSASPSSAPPVKSPQLDSQKYFLEAAAVESAKAIAAASHNAATVNAVDTPVRAPVEPSSFKPTVEAVSRDTIKPGFLSRLSSFFSMIKKRSRR